MTKIITENFKTETTHSLYDSLALHNYYVMASASLTRSGVRGKAYDNQY